nr:unnamed protein product [Callosobruchus analis]
MAEWYPFDKLSLKQLTFKMVILLALISGQRLQTLANIDINHIKETKDELQVFIVAKIKTSGRNRLQPVLTPEKEHRLILTLKKPIHAASSQTISHWIKNVLRDCGIDTDMFSAYSSRHSSTSTALKGGANIETIRKAAGWTERSKVFSKFYNKPIVPNNSDFANSVLKGSGII